MASLFASYALVAGAFVTWFLRNSVAGLSFSGAGAAHAADAVLPMLKAHTAAMLTAPKTSAAIVMSL